MEFRIHRTCMQQDSEELAVQYPVLRNYGLHDKTIGSSQVAHINISSMSKLKQLIEDVKESVIVSSDPYGRMVIEIYDDWRE